MFVLGRLYYRDVPGLANMGLVGAITLSLALIAVFIGIGWVYDRRLKLWNEAAQVTTERYPYQYVPDPRARMMDYPCLYAVLDTLMGLAPRMGLNTGVLYDLVEYLADYFARSPESRRDIHSSIPSSEALMQRHPFRSDERGVTKKVRARRSIGKSFQLETLRLGWIQSLTGMVQDVLVFAVLYGIILFPGLAGGDFLSVDYLMLAIVVLALPIFAVLMALGWYYDRILKVWSADVAVSTERNPYSYVPAPTVNIMHVPMYYTLFFFFWKNSDLLGVDKSMIERTLSYLDRYSSLSPSRDEDIKEWSAMAAKRKWFIQQATAERRQT
jgi:hypothetical protein